MLVADIIKAAVAAGGSDIHLIYNVPPVVRSRGQVERLDMDPLTEDDCISIAKDLAGSHFDELEEVGELDVAKNIGGERVRINVFRQQGKYSAALRILRNEIPDVKTLGLPKAVLEFPNYKKGIVLVTGETGSGKSTTLAALLNEINHTRKNHIITLEDPIEYIYEPDQCIINQREIGKDTGSYASGLRAVLREDPDIILIGEMRDLDTIDTAITAAETGHLVFATLHTNSAIESVDRIINVFPSTRQQQIRMELASTLKAVVSQQLLPNMMGNGRVLAAEVMVSNPAIQNQIREGKTYQMGSTMLASSADGCVTMDACLANLALTGKISPQTAMENATDKDTVKKKMMM